MMIPARFRAGGGELVYIFPLFFKNSSGRTNTKHKYLCFFAVFQEGLEEEK